jgi:CheY-like chemotaxis protein
VNKKLSSVLLIDDNPDDNWYHKKVIEDARIAGQISVIDDSRKALQWWKEGFVNLLQFPELIFVDINMPAYNGFELLELIRELPDPGKQLQRVKIFMLTGSINPEDRQRADTEFKDIITGFQTKPLSAKNLEEILEEHF